MRVLVTGSRTWENYDGVIDALREYAVPGNTLVSGHCPRGADLIAEWAWTNVLNMPKESLETHPANWTMFGKQAGFMRNEHMVSLGADVCLAFIGPCATKSCRRKTPHDSHGTLDCMALARKAGIEVKEHRAWQDPADIGG